MAVSLRTEEVDEPDNIAFLAPDETVRLDADRIIHLYQRLGEHGATQCMMRAIEELTVRLDELGPLAETGRHREFARKARGLVGIADEIGMTQLARVAADVAATALSGDTAAFGATQTRLSRIADRSLAAVWDMQDMSV